MISKKMQDYLAASPDRVVIREMGGREYTLHQLRRDVLRLASALEGRVGRCERKVFGIAMRSCYEWVYTLLAIQKVGAVLLPVPIEFSDDQIASLLGKATAVLVSDEQTAGRLHGILPDKPCFIPDQLMGQAIGDEWRAEDELIPEGIVSIIHTSGTTSKPKGVMIRDEAVGLLVDNVMKRLPQQPLHYFSIVPMSLLIEQVLGVFIPILSGGTLTLMPKGVAEYGAASGNARQYLEMIAPNQPNFLYLPPKLLEEANMLLEQCSVQQLFGAQCPHIITGGAKIPVSCLTGSNGGAPGYACAGISYGDSAKLFSEYYLDQSLDRRYGLDRARIAEVGAFASFRSGSGAGKYLLDNVIKTLALRNFGLVVLTATDQVRQLLTPLVDSLDDLGPADSTRVKDPGVNWGSYYHHEPRVVAARLSPPSIWMSAPSPGVALATPHFPCQASA